MINQRNSGEASVVLSILLIDLVVTLALLGTEMVELSLFLV